MPLKFDYPVTRYYPWRFTSLSIIGVSIVVLGLLTYVNLAFVGMTMYSRNSYEFTEWREPSRIDQLDVYAMNNYTLGCESATLVTGATYQTLNGAFTYTIQSLYNRTLEKRTSNANYNGSVLNNCTVDAVDMSTDLSAHKATFEATVNCSFPGNLEVILATNTVIEPPFQGSTRHIDSRSTALAQNASRLLSAAGFDYFYVAVLQDGNIVHKNISMPLTTYSYPFRLHQNSTIEWLSGSTMMTRTLIWRNPSQELLEETISSQIVAAMENYLRMLYSSVLSDLGITSQSNVMTSTELFKHAIKPIDFSFRGAETQFSGNMSKIDSILADISSYGLPFTSVESTRLNIPYLCHYRAWKNSTTLVTDVCVATVSFFMVFWTILKAILEFFARRTTIDGKYCPCENCKTSHEAGQKHKLVLNEKKFAYNRVPSEDL